MISVIVLTYNDPRRLRLCLHSLLRQTQAEFELLVVHDGGNRQINQPVYAEMRRHGRDISELWLGPESSDFRAAAARNLGLRHAHGERVLFVDGDCILMPNVVAEHTACAAKPVLVCGARNHLSGRCLEWLTPGHFDQLDKHLVKRDIRLYFQTAASARLRASLRRGEPVVLLSHRQVFSFQLSVPTALARRIGGFNEMFVGWGGEDMEFGARMRRVGATLLGRFDLICFHLDHPRRVCNHRIHGRVWRSLSQPDSVRNGGPLPAPTEVRQVQRPPAPAKVEWPHGA